MPKQKVPGKSVRTGPSTNVNDKLSHAGKLSQKTDSMPSGNRSAPKDAPPNAGQSLADVADATERAYQPGKK